MTNYYLIIIQSRISNFMLWQLAYAKMVFSDAPTLLFFGPTSIYIVYL